MDSINIKNRFSIKISTLKRIIASDFLDRHKQKGLSRQIWRRNISKHILLLRVCREALQWESWTRLLNERLTASERAIATAYKALDEIAQYKTKESAPQTALTAKGRMRRQLKRGYNAGIRAKKRYDDIAG